MKKTLTITLCILLSLFLGTASAVEVTVFGPKQYLRTTGSPDVYTDTFPWPEGEGMLIVKNGQWDGEHRITDAISSASVVVNGQEIFGTSDFNQQVYSLEAPINIAESNSILVELASNPGSYITIQVTQEIALPTVTISADPEYIHVTETSTLSWTSSNADSATIDQGIGDVDVSGSATVSPTAMTTYTITVTNLGGTGTATATVTVVNTAPVADPHLATTDEDTGVLITLTGWDVDGDALTYQVTSGPTNGTLTGVAPDLTYMPSANWYGTDTFTFTVDDGTVYSTPATVAITVNPVNDVPVVVDDAATTDEDTAVTTGNVLANDTDVDEDILSVSSFTPPVNGTAVNNGDGTFTYTPNADYNGTDSFTYTTDDGNGGSATATVAITVTPVNDVPVANAGPDQSMFRGDAVVLDGSGSSDVDVDPLTYQWAFLSVPAGSTAILSNSTLVNPTFVPDMSGVYEVQVIVNDGTVDSLPDTVWITANPRIVQVPDVVGVAQAVAEASIAAAGLAVGTITTAHSATVPEGHVINQGPAAGASVEENSLVDLVVSLGAEPPTASISAAPVSITAGQSFTLTWSSTDADSCIIEPGIGSVAVSGSMSVTPTETATYNITATGPGGTATDSVTVTVIYPPTVSMSADPETIESGESANLTWTSTNADTCVIEPGVGTVDPNGSTAVSPTETTTYTITATGLGGTATAAVTLNVNLLPLSVSITSPTDAAEFTQGPITVTGTVSRSEATVSVNAIEASVVGNEFMAEDIPLTLGSNTITAQAQEGAVTAEDTITVFLMNIDLEPFQLEITSLTQDPQSLKVSGELTVTVVNNGSSDVTDPYRIVLFEDTDNSGAYETESDNLLGETSVASGPGAGAAVDVSAAFVGELLFRDNSIYVFVDSDNDLEETDETNNLLSSRPVDTDVSASFLRLVDTGCPDLVTLTVRTGNSGGDTLYAGVPVAFYDGDPSSGGGLIGTTSTTQSLDPGHYEDVAFQWTNPSPGIRDIYVKVDDDGAGTGILDETDEENNLVFYEMDICAAQPLPGPDGLAGAVIDAVTGAPLSGAEVTLHMEEGGEPGTVVAQYTTAEHGWFVFSGLDSGSYILKASIAGYITAERPLVLAPGEALTHQDIVLSPVLGSEEVRIVLTWGETPEDLEAHLTGTNPQGCRHHCYYWSRDIPGANLDLDDMNSYGPETITITQEASGTYRYYVHDFTNRGSGTSQALSLSGAQVKVYFGSGADPLNYTVPAQAGTVWHVFNLDGDTGEVTPINRMAFRNQPGEIDFPAIISSPVTRATWGTPYTYQVEAEDPDLDILEYTLLEAPEGMSLDPISGLIQWTPSGGQGGYQDVSLRVSDGRCGEDTQTFSIYVTYIPVVNFSVEPCSGFNPGGDITLSWTTDRAETVVIDQGIGEVSSSGSLTIPSPETPIAYTLTATNGAGETKKTVPRKPSISYPYGFFIGTPTSTSPGGSVTLSWSVPCASTCIIDQGIGEVALSGSREVTINGTTHFTLTATNGAGSVSRSIIIRVEQCYYPEVEFNTASLCAWSPGDPVTLTWRSLKCVDFCEIDQGIGQVPLSGSIEVTPDQPTTYTLSASCASCFGDPVQRRVNVPNLEPVDITLFRASPYYLLPGESSTLSWSTKCADSCTIDQGVGDVDTSGSVTVTPAYLPITYTMTATNVATGSKTKYVTIRHTAPIATLSVSPQIIKGGETATLSWTTEYATSCTLLPIGEVDLSGSMIVQPEQQTEYNLWAQGPGGSTHKRVTLRYVKPTAQIYADPEYIHEGESSTLSWVFSNADTCTIDQGIGEVQLGESISVSPQETTTYTIRATGIGGIVVDSVTVTLIYPPSITVQQPDGVADTAYDSFTIQWTDADLDDDASIFLYYDIDNSGENGTLIVSGLSEDPDGQGEDYYVWDTAEIAEGAYYVYAVIDDGMHDPVVDYSDGLVTIVHTLPDEIKLTASDLAGYDEFGYSVAISGNYAIVGVPWDDDHGSTSGSAYIFKRRGSTWVEQAKLTASDAAASDYFGWSVSISGDYAVVGTYNDSAFIFKREGSVWIEQGKLTASDAAAYDYFGYSVSISGDYAIVGAYGDDDGGSYSGSAYVFKREGTTWTEQAKLTASDAAYYDWFGSSVAISGDYAVIGAPLDDDAGSYSGSAYIFKRDGLTWIEQGKLIASDAAASDNFGESVSISGDTAIVGAPDDDDGGSNSGSAYVFKRDGTTWTEQAKLTASDAAYSDAFGRSVSISGDTAIAGAYANDDGGNASGSAYIFKRDGTTWTERAKLTASDAAASDFFGYSVAVGGGSAIVGATGDDDAGSRSGSAYVYTLCTAEISAHPEVIEIGASTTLRWTSNDAESLSIDQGIGSVPASGSVVVSPPQTTTYTITATGLAGPVIDSVTVSTIDPSVPATVSISANPDTFVIGESSILSWNTTNAQSVTIDNGIGDVPLNDSLVVSPTETTTYTVTATSPGGTATANVIVTVIHPPSITVVEPDGIGDNANTSFTIQWTDADPDDDATISLYYDINNNGSDGTLIVSGLSEDPDGQGNDEYVWDTTDVAEGSYYVYAVIDDGVNDPAADYSNSIVTIDHTISSIEAKLTAGDAAAADYFGRSVSISGDYAIVGAYGDDDGGSDSGSAYIFKREGTTWTEQAKLTASDAAAADYFGLSVSISGDYAIVSASGNDNDSGSAYIFKREGTTWTEQAKLKAGDATGADYFGSSVSISGDYAVIGANGDDDGGSDSGSAYVFKRDGTTWVEQAKLTAGDPWSFDYFGSSVSISGDYAVVGAYADDDGGSYSGSAYIFKREGTTWVEQAKLTASDAAAADYFGYSVSISGDYAVVGAYADDDGGSYSGSAYIFKRDGTIWTEQAKLKAGDAAASDYFGRSVSIDGDYAVISSPGDDVGGSSTGSAYIFKRKGTTWTEQAKLTANYAATSDGFGTSVSIGGDYAILGATGDDDGGSQSGAAYIYPISTVKIITYPETILIGESSTLSWSSINVDTLSIDQGIGSVPAVGSVVVTLEQTTTYTITATGPAGTFTDSVTVNVIDPSVPATVSMSANPETIQVGESSTLSWSSTNANSCVIEPGIGTVDPSGLITVSPTETTTYTITASSLGGSTDTASVTVTVTYPVPTVSISADPETIPVGESATLSWTSTDADTCTIDHGIGSVELSGSRAVSPAETTTYTVTATGPGGSSEANVMVTVNHPPSIAVVEPDGIEDNANTSFTIKWTDTDPDDNATISLYYDINGSGSDGTLIVGELSEDPDGEGNDEYRWMTAEIPEGTYYVYAVIDDGVSDPVVEYSAGVVRFDHTILEEVKLTASDAAGGDYFGYSVSISGDYAIVGARCNDDGGSNSGSAYIFKREGTTWIEQAKLTAGDAAASNYFGHSVSISGDTAVVGAYGDDVGGSNSGSAYIFKREGTIWTEQAKLTASDAAALDLFGISVSISGDYAIVGARWDDDGGSDSGSAYIFKREGTTWTEQAKLTASDAAADDRFGESVSISGDTAVVGVQAKDDVGYNSGSAYIFKREGSTWTEQAKLTASDAAAYDSFGCSVSISGDTVVVGARGSTYIFKREDTIWTEQAKLTASDAAANNLFGCSVSISGDYAIVGAFGDADEGYRAGSAYIFKREGTTWTEQAKLNANYAEASDFFGYSVSISGDYAVVGAYGDNDDGYLAGSAYVYSISAVNVNVIADPEIILIGESAIISWSSINVDTLSIDQGIGSVSAGGSVLVSPQQTTTYTITATGPGGTFTDSVTVNVIDPSVPASVSISANPETIQVGESATLTWSSTNADSVSIDQGIGSVALHGSTTVSPTETTTYTITATGPGGTDTASIAVTLIISTTTITGTVTDSSTGLPLGSATVSITDSSSNNQSVLTAADGTYTVNIAPGAFSGTITRDLYSTHNISDTVSPGQTLTIDAVLDPVPPTITNVAVSNITGDSATITWTTDHLSDSLVEYGTTVLYGSSESDASMTSSHSIVLTGLTPGTTYHYIVTSTNSNGVSSSSADDTFTTFSPITVTILIPSDNDTINRPDAVVRGGVSNSTGNETGVTVNGVVAVVYNGEFVVNGLPLDEGQNTITAVATDTAGNAASHSILIDVDTSTPYVTLKANVESGIAPLTTYFSVSTSIPDSVVSYSMDFEGDGVVDYTGPTFDDVSFTYTAEGIYYPTVYVLDDQSNVYTDSIVIMVLNQAELDTLLQAKWSAMTSSLNLGDMATALALITPAKRADYEVMFNALAGQISSIMATWAEFNLISIKNNSAKYELVTIENAITYSYEVVFIRNKTGLWEIVEF